VVRILKAWAECFILKSEEEKPELFTAVDSVVTIIEVPL
jgi:hypothetical protein